MNLTLKEIVAENNEFECLQYRFAAMIQRLKDEKQKLTLKQRKEQQTIAANEVQHRAEMNMSIQYRKDSIEN